MKENKAMFDDDLETLFHAFPPVSSEAWHRKVLEDLKGADFEQCLVWKPLEGFQVQPYYRTEDLASLQGKATQSDASFQRAENQWHIRQDISLPDLPAAHRRACEALTQGATSLGFVLATSAGDRFGIPVSSQTDFERLLETIPLEGTPVHFNGISAVPPVIDMLLHEAARRGLDVVSLSGSAAYDPFSRLVRHGRFDVAAALDESVRIMERVEPLRANLHVLLADTEQYHEAGATAVHELAFALATASEYLARGTDHDLTVTQLARRLRFRMPVGTSYFMEIAKFRALRRLFALLVQAYDQESAPLYCFIEAVTSRWSLTRYDQHTNLLRATTQAAAAIIGGCDELTIRPFDLTNEHPSDDAFRLARNIQLILKHEAHLDAVSDPAAGSYYLELLTDRLAERAWTLFQHIEARGGFLQTLRSGFIQDTLRRARLQRADDIATRRRVLVGTNQYPNVEESLLQSGPSTQAPLPPVSQEALTVEPIPAMRAGEPFETLRLRTERFTLRTGRRPSVLLVPFGHPGSANARAVFSRNFFGCAGFDILEAPPSLTVDQAWADASNQQVDIVVLCSSDDDYQTAIPKLAEIVKSEVRPLFLVVAGYPKASIHALKSAGVDDFIHRGQNLLETLSSYQERLGIDSD
ncbi:MAG: methylmalonyl-CoA mutase family protein [Rhodothermales bacterium]